MQNTTDHSRFDNSWYKPGKGALLRALWYILNRFLMQSAMPGSAWRRGLLRLFGSKIGRAVILKPQINVKYPWRLEIGDYSWIGEGVWIDNLGMVKLGKNCCLSQGAMLLCGNHHYGKSAFDLMVGDITLEDGVWIGAKAIVCPGVLCKSHSVLSVGGVATSDLEAYGIYAGNPAQKVRERKIEN